MTRSGRVTRVPGNAAHRSQELHQGGQVVGTHVEHRPAPRLVVERRVGVPALVARAGIEGDRVQGSPIQPSSSSLRLVWWPPPKKVSGAQPSSTPARAAARTRSSPSARCTASGFSLHTCLPASMAARDTAWWAAGMVRDPCRIPRPAPGPAPAAVGAGDQVQDRELAAALAVGGADLAAADDPTRNCSSLTPLPSDGTEEIKTPVQTVPAGGSRITRRAGVPALGSARAGQTLNRLAATRAGARRSSRRRQLAAGLVRRRRSLPDIRVKMAAQKSPSGRGPRRAVSRSSLLGASAPPAASRSTRACRISSMPRRADTACLWWSMFRSSCGCRRPARGGRPSLPACAGSPAPSARSASVESQSCTESQLPPSSAVGIPSSSSGSSARLRCRIPRPAPGRAPGCGQQVGAGGVLAGPTPTGVDALALNSAAALPTAICGGLPLAALDLAQPTQARDG